jgi:DNA-binding MurR/RpiR family transcriptional regulator
MQPPIDDRLRAAKPDLTPAETRLVDHVLDNYPVAALGSITTLANGAGVSKPTVVRLVQKLGFRGYPDFQTQLRTEVEGMLASPLTKHDKWSGRAPDAHILNRFADQVMANLHATLRDVNPADFDAAASLLADRNRRVYVLGGRITHALALYLATLLRVVRPDVVLLSDMSNSWPPALLDMKPGDVLAIFDIRRYENTVTQIAELAREQGAEVILFTDRWGSPARVQARISFACHIEAPSIWDSNVALLVMIETLLAAVQDTEWVQAEDRLRKLEGLYDRVSLFRRLRGG